MGLLFGVMSVTMAVLSPVSGMLSDRLGASVIILFSLLVMLGTYALVGIGLGPGAQPLACVGVMILIGAGMGFYMSPSHSAVMGAVSKAHLGVVSSLLILCRTLGQTAGVAVLGAAWAGWVRSRNLGALGDKITDAPVQARIYGFQNISVLMAVLTLLALILTVWGMHHHRRQKQV